MRASGLENKHEDKKQDLKTNARREGYECKVLSCTDSDLKHIPHLPAV